MDKIFSSCAGCAMQPEDDRAEILSLEKQKYIAVTITDCMYAPLRAIPNAYKMLMIHMSVNGIKHKDDKKIIPCFEKEYDLNGTHYMVVYIAIE